MNRILLVAVFTTAIAVCVSAQTETANTAFNPKISVIFDGVYYTDNIAGDGIERLEQMSGIFTGHGHGEEEHEELSRGFNLRETELTLSASVDPYFDAWLTVAFTEGESEIEEAYFETRALPAGWKIKAGKFLSGIGYQNAQHLHSWNFADQNLAYQAILGEHGLADKGLQVNYQPATDFYTLLGVELLQGEQEKFGSLIEDESLSQDAGPRLATVYAKFAPDLGANSALQMGFSLAHAGQHQEDHSEGATVEHLDGNANLWGIDVVYKKLATGAYGHGSFNIQAEYLFAEKNLTIVESSTSADIGAEISGEQDGFYLQAIYGFAPRWTLGARYDAAGLTNELTESTTQDLDDSKRFTLALTWYPTEFSKLRLQFTQADISVFDEVAGVAQSDDFRQVFLQYNISLGAHGAHQF